MAAHKGAFMSLFTTVGRTWRHTNNLVVLAHVQLKLFYRLSTRDVTHVRKCTRPSPAFRTASDGKLGEGLGTRLSTGYITGTVSEIQCLWYHCVREVTGTVAEIQCLWRHTRNQSHLYDGIKDWFWNKYKVIAKVKINWKDEMPVEEGPTEASEDPVGGKHEP